MIKQFFKDTPNSVFFWNGLALLAFIILCSMGEDVALSTMLLISIPAFFMIIINFQEARYDETKRVIGYHWWAYLAPVTWVILLIGVVLVGIVHIIFKVSDYTESFNNWLNQK